MRAVLFASVLLLASPATAQINEPDAARETEHRIAVRFVPGLAIVRSTVVVETSAEDRAELVYDVARAHEGGLQALRVCREDACREGAPDRSPATTNAYELSIHAPPGPSPSTRPVAHAHPAWRRISWAHPSYDTLRVRAAPLSAEAPLTLTTTYVVPTELHGGRVSLRLPITPGEGQATVTLEAPGMADARIDEAPGPVEVDRDRLDPTWVRLTARLAPGVRGAAYRVPCGQSVCTHLWMGSGLAQRPRDVFLAIDASHSMRDVPRARLVSVLNELLATLPAGSTVRAAAFADEARLLLGEPTAPEDVDAAALDLSSEGLGPSTHPSAGLDALRPLMDGARDPLVLFVTDGHLVGQSIPAAPGAEVSVITLTEEPDGGLRDAVRGAGGQALDLFEAEALTPEVLRARLTRLTAEVLDASARLASETSPLRAGEQLVWSGRGLHRGAGAGVTVRPRAAPPEVRQGLTDALAHFGTESHHSALAAVNPRAFGVAAAWSRPGQPRYPAVPGAVALDHHYSSIILPGPCDGTTPRDQIEGCGRRRARVPIIHACGDVRVRGSLSREAIRRVMRHAAPTVSSCFADARRGRRDFEARAVFHLVLAYREVVHASFDGPGVTDELRACFRERVVPQLVVPPMDAPIAIHYPFVTHGAPAPAEVELADDVRDLIDAVAPPAEGESRGGPTVRRSRR